MRLPLRIHVILIYSSEPKRLRLAVKMFNVFRFRWMLSEGRAESMLHKLLNAHQTSPFTEEGRTWMGLVTDRMRKRAIEILRTPGLKQALRRVRRSLLIERLRVSIRVGTGDASTTAQFVGRAWAVAGIVLWLLRRMFSFVPGQPSFVAVPDFHNKRQNAQIDCIARLRLGDIIAAAVRLMVLRRRYDRIGRATAPHRRPHENRHGKHQRHGGC